MPKDGSAGWSEENTPVKQDHFEKLLAMHLRIVRGVTSGRPWAQPEYLYLDLNAGPGLVEGREGSPLIFLRIAVELGVPFRAFLFERGRDEFARLEAAVMARSDAWSRLGRVRCVPGDHHMTAPAIAAELAQRRHSLAHGLVYADPNGRDLPVGPICTLLARGRLERVDVLAHVSATAFKRVATVHGQPRLPDELATIDKRHLWLREPVADWQWTFAILTNWAGFPRLKKQGFSLVGTPEGDAVLQRLTLTRRELRAAGEDRTAQLRLVV